MIRKTKALASINSFIHKNYGIILIITCIIATISPEFGLYIEQTPFTTIMFPDGATLKVTLNIAAIQLILINVSMCINHNDLKNSKKYIRIIVGFIMLDVLLGIIIACASKVLLTRLLPFTIIQEMIIAIAVIAACPSAATSAAWSQVSGGKISLSLGMILASTLFSPVISPSRKRCKLFYDICYSYSLYVRATYTNFFKREN